jgi:uncharacterized protein YndB with AHSA1/START domain
MSEVEVIEAVRKELVVPGSPDRAFRIFTEGLGTWWPLLTHSVGQESAVTVTMDCRLGGRIVERVADGTEHVWGTITSWGPPEHVAFTWHPGRPDDNPTDVEVTFSAEAEDTRVVLEHRGWERWQDGARYRANYETGWDPVLARLAAAAKA